VPRIISAATASAIADAVNLRRRILAAEQPPAEVSAG